MAKHSNKKKTPAKRAKAELTDEDLKGVAGGLTLNSPVLPVGQLAAPNVPGQSVLSASISSVGTIKTSTGG